LRLVWSLIELPTICAEIVWLGDVNTTHFHLLLYGIYNSNMHLERYSLGDDCSGTELCLMQLDAYHFAHYHEIRECMIHYFPITVTTVLVHTQYVYRLVYKNTVPNKIY